MKKQSLLITIMLSLLFLSSNPESFAQEQGNRRESSFSDLTLGITAPKEVFNQLEPIPLIVSLSNKTDRPVLGHLTLKFAANYVHLFVRQVGGDKRRIENLSMIQPLIGAYPQKILPGSVLQEKQLVDLELDKIFPYPGEYQLQARLLDIDGKKTIESNLLRIQILEPTGLDRQAFDFIKNNGNPSYFLNGYDRVVDNKPLTILEEFVSRFSGTAYGDYAIFQLAGVYFAKEDYEKAIKHLEKLANKSDFAFAERAREFLDQSQEKSRQKADK